MQIISVKNLTKVFNANKVVDNVCFDVKKGEIFGLLGPNGAGKTTTIRMLTGVLEPTGGQVFIEDFNIQKSQLEAKQIMGIVPEMANAYLDLSATKNLLLIGELYGIKSKRRTKKAEELLKRFKLYEKKDQKVKTFSKGMKQRVILAMALMNDSKILFLDEPTSGLDVESVRLIRDIIKEINKEQITILLTTHNIEEANLLCDRVAIMNFGKIVAIDRPESLKNEIQSTSSVEVAFEEKVDLEKLKFKNVNRVEKAGDKLRLYTQKPKEVFPLLIDYARTTNNKIVSINTLGPSLEDVFIKLTKN